MSSGQEEINLDKRRMKQVNDDIKFTTKERYSFTIPIFEAQLENVDNRALAEFSRTLRDTTEGVTISNRGGWHSKDLPENLPTVLIEFLNTLERYAQEFIGQYTGVNDLVLGNLWININGPNDYNAEHDHQNSVLSGVYYIEVPQGDSGDLHLHRGDTAEYFLGRYRNAGPFFRTTETVKPETGKLVIFPAWTKHSVGRNNTNSERISIAFNLVDGEKANAQVKPVQKVEQPQPVKRAATSWGQW